MDHTDEVSKAIVETSDLETKPDRFAAYELFSRMFPEIWNHGLVLVHRHIGHYFTYRSFVI